jgi:hypothetical protein
VTAILPAFADIETGWFNFVDPPELLNPYPESKISPDSFKPNPVFPLDVATE